MWRHLAWTSLLALILVVACGPTTVTDINDGASGDDDIGGDDDDDDDGATTTPTGSSTPNGQPTLTNVPSFATWNSAIRPIPGANCETCHGGSGGVYFDSTPADASAAKYLWFTAICNRTSGGDGAGTQSYDPPTGRYSRYMSGNVAGSPTNHVATGGDAATINNWFAEGAGTTVPNCLDPYDLANSN